MNRLKNIFYRVRSKIAFYPTIISITGILVAFIFIYLEQRHVSKYLMEIAPGLVIDNTETARTLLSTLIGGLISLMVFSFSMVMILLNQASSNFSPRVLPGIISDEKHQIVLGLYIAVILYNIFILVSIEPTDATYQTPGFSVLIAIILTVICLASFIYFIHHISQSIQVSTILYSIHSRTKERLANTIEAEKETSNEFTPIKNWTALELGTTGYFQGILKDDLLGICLENELKITLNIKKGQFVLCDEEGIMVSKPVSEKLKKKILKSLIISNEELTGDNYIYGFRQISEIGIKAMSPGINDPGTALNSIDYLTELFTFLLRIKDFEYVSDKKGNNRVQIKRSTFPEVLYNVLATYRPYCTHDVMVTRKLLYMLTLLSQRTVNSEQTDAIRVETDNLENDIKRLIQNERDLTRLKDGFHSWS
ncbi:DUF2254 domain-containing protein [Maribacter litopenaei]|uniref:DUF2254 domain-containing protein n=1 Tax=Maribacter litopenaei TaxID=2976127 RepID=A0ABY5YBP7_9FLAO|nr:DUF2254 domain-containing protein [Maribacter litopenaei]UWX55860.1 DUF2254 domain-containing protein [Maribacter litopenaei]